MDEVRAEVQLAVLYSTSAFLSIVSTICLVIAWQHWAWTLDVCIGIDCGCILYGVNTFSTFMGGDVKLCHFGTYGPLPILAIGLCLGGYHGYRSCFSRNLAVPRNISSRFNYRDGNSVDGEVVVIGPKSRSTCKQWMPAAFLAALIGCLALAHAVVITDGYYKTCEQYRRNLVELLGSRGRETQAIYNRLSCGAILDFMDYVQPDANNWRRGDEINTGLALQFAIVATWFNFFAWFFIFLVNCVMARRRSVALGDSKLSCCCCC